MTREPWAIQISPVQGSLLEIDQFTSLPEIPRRNIEIEEVEIVDPPIPLSEREENIWRREQVQDRSAHLYLIGTILKGHGLRDDLIIEALAHHHLSIDKYIGRTIKEAARIVEKLRVSPSDVELTPKMIAWNWLDFMTHPTRVEWMVENTWIDRSVGFISGRAKSFKSWVAWDFVLSVVSGTPVLDTFEVNKTGPVVVIQEEDPHSVIKERLGVISHHKGINLKTGLDFGTIAIEFLDLPIVIINLQGFKLENTEKVGQLLSLLRQLKPRLVVMDPFINVVQADLDEYRGIQVANTLQLIKMWREEHDCGVLIVHHWNKNEGSNIGGTRMYGSFAFHAWLESALHIRPHTEEGVETNEITIEREFKAAPSGNALRVQFDIETKKDWRYIPTVLGASRSSPQGLRELIQAQPGINHTELSNKSGQKPRALKRIVEALAAEGTVIMKSEGGKVTYYLPEPKA